MVKSKLRLLSLMLHGSGAVGNITASAHAHMRHFYDAADWMIRHQDDKGGWPIPVPRKVSELRHDIVNKPKPVYLPCFAKPLCSK